MTDQRDTTEMLHELLAQLDGGKEPNSEFSHIKTVVRELATVVDSLDQRLKRLEESQR